ncbi:MAG: FAD-dependent oxidoreductase [Bacteroidetes bacterium]|nr:FAD-dependent oxidoreductase [Bacteroidota bacterium]
MLKQTIDILTSYDKPKKVCIMGNVAVARAAIECRVDAVFSYPGTPSTEVSEVFNHVSEFQGKPAHKEKYPALTSYPVYFEYSVNEKIALEKAIACSIGGKSAMCVMKNVGMNVASDALMTITYQTIGAPLVLVVCDDPGCHSSSNEQDSRYWGPMASIPVFNPSSPLDACRMTKDAFVLSGKIKLPVMVRMTTRVSHTRGMTVYHSIPPPMSSHAFRFLPEHINIPARTGLAHKKLLSRLDDPLCRSMLKKYCVQSSKGKNEKMAVISSGVASVYFREISAQNNLSGKLRYMEAGMIHPIPENEIRKFLQNGCKKVLVLEELEPFIENAVRIVAQKYSLPCKIYGKNFSSLTVTGEYSLDIVRDSVEEFSGIRMLKNKKLPVLPDDLKNSVSPRPPVLCAGCPHRATFYLLKLLVPREQKEMILCGDIGCFGLGALPPLKMIDTIHHMGMSISMAQGLYEAMKSEGKEQKTVALVGDGTFFHSGISSLMNAVYTRANMLVVIFDNRTIGMTGHQDHPGAAHPPKYNELDIVSVVKGLGVKSVETINPFNLRESYQILKKAMLADGVSVVVAKAPCIFLTGLNLKKFARRKIVIDPERCNSCANHCDMSLSCSLPHTQRGNLVRAKMKIAAHTQIPAQEQLCPANICNHGFLNAIQTGDFKSAVEIVRDKMLFSKTCGDICHRPCELFATNHVSGIVPIRSLKKFVSSKNGNYRDFAHPIQRARSAKPNGKKIAIIGAGPAGLSAAYDLVQAGFQVIVYDKENKPGGMVTYAIPSFRMDKEAFIHEAGQLEKMGVTFHFKKVLGKEITLEELSGANDAVLLAIGLNRSKKLEIVDKNVPDNQKWDVLTFLKDFHLNRLSLHPGSAVLVIGGGNSAIDAARTVKKLSPMNIVLVSCIETSDAMPAFPEETGHALQEGILILHDSYVQKCTTGTDGKISIDLLSYGTKKMLSRFECDYVITAIGQESACAEFSPLDGQYLDENNRIIKQENGYTGYKNIFVAGDLCSGNHMSVIGAIAGGKMAATGIRKFLGNYSYDYEGKDGLERLNRSMPARQAETIIINGNLAEITDQYNLYQSCMKCNHCIENFGCPAMLRVNGKVQVDMDKCTLCGFCIDVCPNDAVRWEMEGM